MVDRSTLREMGWAVLAVGLAWSLASPKLAQLFTKNLRLKPAPDGAPRPTPAQKKAMQPYLTVGFLFGGLMWIVVGAMWGAGIG